jgi:hypothetical protein
MNSQEQTAARVRQDAASMSLQRTALRATTQKYVVGSTNVAVDINAMNPRMNVILFRRSMNAKTPQQGIVLKSLVVRTMAA